MKALREAGLFSLRRAYVDKKGGAACIMNENTQKTGNVGSHTVYLDRRQHTMVTGVSEVSSFDENEVVLKVDGGVMIVTGEHLHVGKLLLDEGKLDVEGHVDGIIYEVPRQTTGKLLSRWRHRR